MGWKEKADRAKKLHRPSLKNWGRDGLHATFPRYASTILSPSAHPYSSFRIDPNTGQAVESSMSIECARQKKQVFSSEFAFGCAGMAGSATPSTNTQPTAEVIYPAVLDAYDTPPEVFHEHYEARCIPVVIRNIPHGGPLLSKKHDEIMHDSFKGLDVSDACETRNKNNDGDCIMDSAFGEEKKDDALDSKTDIDDNQYKRVQRRPWPAIQCWSLESLAKDETLLERPLKVGEDDDGYTVRMKLRHFLRYMEENTDDSPLYIFDATFDEDKCAKRLLQDYTVPEYFNEDLLGLVGERRRPPYRWFLVGPCRSGTTVHIDPLGTSAWNTLVHGVKRWVLFPPHVPKSVVKGRKLILPGEDDEAIHYFCTILPRMKRKAVACKGTGEYSNFECYEFTQYAGETVFVPHGWWHAVLNVTDTVGITQNYCSRRNFDVVWMQTRSGRKKMSCSWLRRLEEQYPDLARRAKGLNRRDGFVMWEDDEVEQNKWKKKRAEKERKKREKERAKQLKKERREEKHHSSTEVTQEYQGEKIDTGVKESIALNSAATYGSFGRESKRSRVDGMREVSPD